MQEKKKFRNACQNWGNRRVLANYDYNHSISSFHCNLRVLGIEVIEMKAGRCAKMDITNLEFTVRVWHNAFSFHFFSKIYIQFMASRYGHFHIYVTFALYADL